MNKTEDKRTGKRRKQGLLVAAVPVNGQLWFMEEDMR
jgi:hypothetical protein